MAVPLLQFFVYVSVIATLYPCIFLLFVLHVFIFRYLVKAVVHDYGNFIYGITTIHRKQKEQIEGWAQDCSNSNIFLKPLFRGNVDPFVNNANLGAIAHTSNGT